MGFGLEYFNFKKEEKMSGKKNEVIHFKSGPQTVQQNKEIREISEKLKKAQRNFCKLDENFGLLLETRDSDGQSGLWAKIMRKTKKVLRLGREQQRPLRNLSKKIKHLICLLQETLTDVSKVASNVGEELHTSKKELGRIKEENWKLSELREYFLQKAEMTMPAEVSWISKREIELLSEKARERKKSELIHYLENDQKAQASLLRMLGQSAGMALEVLEKASVQYLSLTKVVEPIEILRQATEDMGNIVLASDDATQVIKGYMGQIEQLMNLSVASVGALRDHLIASDSTTEELQKHADVIAEAMAQIDNPQESQVKVKDKQGQDWTKLLTFE